MTREEQLRAGISAETIRLSVGIEHAQDIIEHLDQTLRAAAPASHGNARG
jgi:O-acetylhomoserine (thiol)-lyase